MDVQLKKCGDSMGFLIPQRIVESFGIDENSMIILGLNDQLRLLERQLLIDKKKYPSLSAIRRMNT